MRRGECVVATSRRAARLRAENAELEEMVEILEAETREAHAALDAERAIRCEAAREGARVACEEAGRDGRRRVHVARRT